MGNSRFGNCVYWNKRFLFKKGSRILGKHQNNPYILLSALGVMIETIVIMAVYSLGVEKKYKEQ